MFRKLFFVVLLLALLLAAVPLAVAQSEATPTQEDAVIVVTVEPDTTVVVDQPDDDAPPIIVIPNESDLPRSNVVMAVFTVLAFVAFGFYAWIKERNSNRMLEAINKALDSKLVQDEAERKFMQSALEWQQVVELFHAFVRVANGLNIPGIDPTVDKLDQFLETTTDGQPNPEPSPPQG